MSARKLRLLMWMVMHHRAVSPRNVLFQRKECAQHVARVMILTRPK
jgi:hypothetical protein